MKNFLISGDTNQLVDWDIEDIISNKESDKERMLRYDWENTIGRYCDGMTYLEIEQFNNTYNNFR
jgi:hypothetical protein